MPNLEVRMVDPRKLVSYENNAKIHTAEQVEQIVNSIKEFGFNDPIGIWENAAGEMEVVEGHGRLMAALDMGLDGVPVIDLSHMTDEQRRAYTHVHNQLTMNTGFDFEALDEELANLNFNWEDFGFEITDTDFDPDKFFGDAEEKAVKEPEPITCPLCGGEFVPEQ